MAGITLLDGDSVKHARGPHLMAPDLCDVRHPGSGQLLFEHGRAHNRPVTGHLIGASAQRRYPEDNGIVAVVDGLDVEHGLRCGASRIVACPLAEWSLALADICIQKT